MAAILVVLRLFAPVKYVAQTNLVSYVPGVWLGGSPEGALIRTAIGITLLHALALAVLAATLCVLFPDPRWARNKRAFVAAFCVFVLLGFGLWALFLSAQMKAEQEQRARNLQAAEEENRRAQQVMQPTYTLLYAPPTLEYLATSSKLQAAALVIDTSVNIFHKTWQELNPDDKDTLCRAGNAIRAAMKAHDNKLADLNHTQRAVYDITASPGRCR